MRQSLRQMLKDWGLALGLTIGVMAVWGMMRGGPTESGPAPDFTLRDLQGSEVSMASLRGQTVVLNFWATWCGPCRQEIPEFAAFHTHHPEIALYGVNVDEGGAPPAIEAVSKRLGVNYPVLLDPQGRVSQDYGVVGLPTTFVIGPEGQILQAKQGTLSRSSLERMIRQSVR